MLGTLASSLAAKRLGYDLLLESGAFRMSQREQRDAPLDQDEQQNIFIALSLP